MAEDLVPWQPPEPPKQIEYLEVYQKAFARTFDEAQDPKVQEGMLRAKYVLEDMLRQKAIDLIFNPVPREVYQRGELVGYETKAPDTKLLQWVLSWLNPQEYVVANKTEVTGGIEHFQFNMGEPATEIEAETGDWDEAA